MNEDRIKHKINQITERIFVLNDKINDTISTSELNKINKVLKKLSKERQKLYDKLYNANSFDEPTENFGDNENE